MNFTGITIGVFTFLAIGFGFLWVIKLEYYVGAQVWKAVALLGILVSLASGCLSDPVASAAVGIFGGTIVWGAFELPDQEKRVAAGLFKRNPGKNKRGGLYGN